MSHVSQFFRALAAKFPSPRNFACERPHSSFFAPILFFVQLFQTLCTPTFLSELRGTFICSNNGCVVLLILMAEIVGTVGVICCNRILSVGKKDVPLMPWNQERIVGWVNTDLNPVTRASGLKLHWCYGWILIIAICGRRLLLFGLRKNVHLYNVNYVPFVPLYYYFMSVWSCWKLCRCWRWGEKCNISRFVRFMDKPADVYVLWCCFWKNF